MLLFVQAIPAEGPERRILSEPFVRLSVSAAIRIVLQLGMCGSKRTPHLVLKPIGYVQTMFARLA